MLVVNKYCLLLSKMVFLGLVCDENHDSLPYTLAYKFIELTECVISL